LRRYRGQVTQIVVLTAIRNGFEIFCITTMGNANTGDSALLGHIDSLLLRNNGVIRKLITSDSATFFNQTNNSLGIGICLRNLI